MWTPKSWSFDKLREVVDLSYLVYFRFKCFVNACVGLRREWPFDRSQNLGQNCWIFFRIFGAHLDSP